METAPPDGSLYKVALIVLSAAGLVVPLCHRLRISPVFVFILIGIAAGPHGLTVLTRQLPWLSVVTISDPASIQPIANLGVVLIMFMIGLELSFRRLWLMRRLVFGLGALQVVVSAALLAGGAALFGLGNVDALVVGLALSMSSTAVVMQVLADRKRLHTVNGRTSFAVLLFQDLAVVPILLTLNALSPIHTTDAGMSSAWEAIGRAALAVTLILVVGRVALRPLFRAVALTRRVEAFVAASLAVVIATGLASASAGLSMPLGALIAGLLLAGTEFRHQIEVTIDPFKGLAVDVFLISVGMTLDLRTVAQSPWLVCATSVGVVLVKLLVTAAGARGLFRLNWEESIKTGLVLGPGGEFGLVIVAAAVAGGLLETKVASLLLFVTALTMALIPLLAKLGDQLLPHQGPAAPREADLLLADAQDELPRIIIAGYGRVGQTVATMLDAHKLRYVAVDQDPDHVARERRKGKPVYFGDVSRIDLLRRLHLDSARALIVTLDDPVSTEQVVTAARAEHPDLLIVTRARDARHAARLYRAGASDAVPETIEASLQLSEAVLTDLGVPMGLVIASIHERRSEIQAEIKAMAPAAAVRELGRQRLRDRAPARPGA